MKSTALVTVGLLIASSATAADLAVSAPERDPQPRTWSWTGLYAGASIGFSSLDMRVKDPLASGFSAFVPGIDPVITAALPRFERNRGALSGGVQLGANLQRDRLVGGVEADFNYPGHNGLSASLLGARPITTTRIAPSSDLDWLGTVRLRAGVTHDRFMVYATGGLAVGKAAYQLNVSQDGLGPTHAGSSDEIQTGWTVGAGAEYALAERITFKSEYLYYDLGRARVTATPVGAIPPGTSYSYDFETRGHLLRAGLNYHF
jgi:outer membrane immunogenic protein